MVDKYRKNWNMNTRDTIIDYRERDINRERLEIEVSL